MLLLNNNDKLQGLCEPVWIMVHWLNVWFPKDSIYFKVYDSRLHCRKIRVLEIGLGCGMLYENPSSNKLYGSMPFSVVVFVGGAILSVILHFGLGRPLISLNPANISLDRLLFPQKNWRNSWLLQVLNFAYLFTKTL